MQEREQAQDCSDLLEKCGRDRGIYFRKPETRKPDPRKWGTIGSRFTQFPCKRHGSKRHAYANEHAPAASSKTSSSGSESEESAVTETRVADFDSMARSELRDFSSDLEETGDGGEDILESCLDQISLEHAFATLKSLDGVRSIAGSERCEGRLSQCKTKR